MNAEELFAEVEEKNRTKHVEITGAQVLNGKYTVFADDGGENGLLLNMDEENARSLYHKLGAVLDE